MKRRARRKTEASTEVPLTEVRFYPAAPGDQIRFLDDPYEGLSKNEALDRIVQNQAKMAVQVVHQAIPGRFQAFPTIQATGASVGLGDPVADWVEEAINKAVTERFEVLYHQQNVLIATMQEQIDELWEEIRDRG